jgi:transposase
MVYVGIDLHRRRSHVAVVDERGRQLFSRRLVNDTERFRALLGELGEEARFVLEATYGWEWLAELLEREGRELHLAHPLRTKAIASARVKTDAVDACTLAQLLRADLLPEAYVAPRELRDLRDLLRQRFVLTQMRTALKNRVHALIARQGVQHGHSKLLGPGGRAFLAELELRPEPRARLDVLLRLIGDFDREIDALAADIDQRAKHDKRVKVLCEIRGIGRYLALLIIAEIGAIERFPSARHLCAWAGLTRRFAAPTPRRGSAISAGSAPARCAGRWSKPPSETPRVTDRWPRPSNGSPSAAAARSPRSPSRARSSPSASTACATARSVASRPRTGRARSKSWRRERSRRALGCAPGPAPLAHTRASSLLCLASTTGRPPS